MLKNHLKNSRGPLLATFLFSVLCVMPVMATPYAVMPGETAEKSGNGPAIIVEKNIDDVIKDDVIEDIDLNTEVNQPLGRVDSSTDPDSGFSASLIARLQAGEYVELIVEYHVPVATTGGETDAMTETDVLRSYGDNKHDVMSSVWTLGVEEVQDYSHLPMNVVRIRSVDAVDALRRHPRVKAVYENRLLHLNLNQSLPLINQPTALSAGATGTGTTVAVLDTGTDYRQSAFGSCATPGGSCKVIVARDFAPDDGSLDNNGHGTNVAGIVLGVAPQAKIAALDVFNATGRASSSDIIDAINWVIANRGTYNIVAMNLSLGGGRFTAPCGNDVFSTPIANARAAGIFPAVASGNENYTNALDSPACVPDAVSVGAVYDSNVGGITWGEGALACTDDATAANQVTCFSNSASFLSLLAPGALITAAGITQGGTSQAAPHVAGAAAALKSLCASATPSNILTALQTSGLSVRDSRNGITKPRIDVAAAAQSLRNALGNCGGGGGTSYALSVSVTGSGTVRSSPAGIDCGSTCSASFANGSSVTLTATPGTGYSILSWGGACSNTANTSNICTVNMNAAKSVIVQFASGSGGCSSSTTAINSGGTASGSLASTDCRSATRTSSTGGYYYYDNFTFAATAGVTYTITMTSTAFDTYLYLLNGSGTALASDDDSGGNGNSRIVHTPTTSGTLTIHATSYSSGATGAYTVTLQGGSTSTLPTAPTGLSASASSANQINLAWSDNSSNESGFRIERRTGTSGTWSEIATVSAGVRAYSNTGLTASTTYFYRVRAYNSAGNSGYSNETSTTTSGSGGCSSSTTAINSGGTASGSLASTDCRSTTRTSSTGGYYYYYDNFTFTAAAGTTYTITLSSMAFDTYLYLLDSAGRVLGDNDDYNGTNSQIQVSNIGTTPVPLVIHATSFSSAATGAYTVALSR